MWHSEQQIFNEEFRVLNKRIDDQLEDDNIVISYDLLEVNEFIQTVNVSSKRSVQYYIIVMQYPDLP